VGSRWRLPTFWLKGRNLGIELSCKRGLSFAEDLSHCGTIRVRESYIHVQGNRALHKRAFHKSYKERVSPAHSQERGILTLRVSRSGSSPVLLARRKTIPR
jgi:hypothetical protein